MIFRPIPRNLVFLLLVSNFILQACDRKPQTQIKGQVNTTVTIYGKVVDQDGHPLRGSQIEYRVEAYPKDWTYDSRGRDNDVSSVTATSDANGSFQFTVTGCKLVRRRAECDGYRHFFEEDLSDGAPQTSAYRLIAWGDLWYQPSVANPAVYVFVKDGVAAASALPCRGGADSGGGKQWTVNNPTWPKKPSLSYVKFKHPASQPTTNLH